MTDKATEIARLLAPTVTSLGVELLGVEYLSSQGGALLRLYIDVPASDVPANAFEGSDDAPPRSVTIEECEAVSREVSAQLDVEDPISANYTLEVSSPGIDRPLFTLEHFKRFVGESAKVTLKLPQDGRRRLQGRIAGIEGEAITFLVDGALFIAAFDNIEKARLIPDWVALGLAPSKPTGAKPDAEKNPGKPGVKPPPQPPSKPDAKIKPNKPGRTSHAGYKQTDTSTHMPAADKPTPAE